jgi:hypothetical protein
MAKKQEFLHELPINSKRLKIAFVSMVVFILLCGVGYVVSTIFWDDYTYQAYSIRYSTQVTKGWPASLQGWSLWLGIGLVVFLPFIFFMQDWRNPSLAFTKDALFLNQQLVRNTWVPFTNIEKLVPAQDGFVIWFRETDALIKQQIFLFKPFVKSNLQSKNFTISSTYTAGNLLEFCELLTKQMHANQPK